MRVFDVDEKGRVPGSYRTVNEAIAALPEGDEEVLIRVAEGTYREKVALRRGNVTVQGAGMDRTVIAWNDWGGKILEDGSMCHTFRSYTFFADGDHITLKDLTLLNDAKPAVPDGQALALYADGDDIHVENVKLDSFQDTLFVGPLPEREFQAGGFTGPKQFAPRIVGTQYYDKCVIMGNVDFIFGSGVAYFTGCEIISRNAREMTEHHADGVTGYVTAPSHQQTSPVGFVFTDCRFTAEDCPDGSAYLGRPWREYGKVRIERCYIGPHICPEGWTDWGKTIGHFVFEEKDNYGPGAAGPRAFYVHQ